MVLGLVASGCFLVHVTRSEELAAGERQAAALEHEMTVIDDSALQAMLDASVGPLRALVRRRDLAWTFRLVDSREVNAFAVAGGRVYVTRALVENAKRYDQLAGAIGHEIGHVDLRHTARAMEKASGITLIFNAAAAVMFGKSTGVDSTAGALTDAAGFFASHPLAAERIADIEGAVAADTAALAMTRVGIEDTPAFREFRAALRRWQPAGRTYHR